MYLQSWTDKPYIVISQSLHGVFQNYVAIDCAHLKGVAPARGKILANYPQKDKKQNYFNFGLDNWLIQLVHAKPLKVVGSFVELAAQLWTSTWHHVHIALKFDGKWYCILGALDWSRVEVYWLKFGQKHPVWTKEGTYTKVELPPYSFIINEMITLQQKVKCKVLATINLNIRKEPNTKAAIIGQLSPNEVFETYKVAAGTKVETTNAWYEVKGGWVSGAYIDILTGNNTLEAELTKANAELKELRGFKEQVKAAVNLFKSIV